MRVILNRYGLSRLPFTKEVRAEDLFTSPRHKEIGDRLRAALEGRASAVLTGEVGVGKTFVLRALQRDLNPSRYKLAQLGDPKRFDAYLRRSYDNDWHVYAKPPFGGPDQVLKYLARYTHRVAISNHRLVSLQNDKVTFRYKDYAHGGGRRRSMTIDAREFIRRFLMHALPKGFVRSATTGCSPTPCERRSSPTVAPSSTACPTRTPSTGIPRRSRTTTTARRFARRASLVASFAPASCGRWNRSNANCTPSTPHDRAPSPSDLLRRTQEVRSLLLRRSSVPIVPRRSPVLADSIPPTSSQSTCFRRSSRHLSLLHLDPGSLSASAACDPCTVESP